jgi:hypothetical protein
MLIYDPLKRATARDVSCLKLTVQCLSHFYFRNKPSSCPSKKLPRAVGGQTHKMQEREGLKIKLDEGVKKIGGGVKRKMSDDAD